MNEYIKKKESLIKKLKSNLDKNYIEFLSKNFDKHIDSLEYERDYLLNLKNTLYNELSYLIHDTADFDIDKIKKNIQEVKKEGFTIEDLPLNLSKIHNVIFTFQGFILFIESHKIYFISIDYNILDGKNDYFIIEGKILLENYKTSGCWLINVEDERFNKIWIGDYYQINDQNDWSGFSNENLMRIFFEKIDELYKNQIKESNPKYYKELSQLMSGHDEINWIPVEPYTQLLEVNENIICVKNVDYLLKFVKLDSFLNTKRKSLITIHKEILNTKDEEFIFKTISILIKQIEYYNQLLLLSINMIVALKSNKMLLFFKIYEAFDQIGVFDSNWEKSLLNKMDELNMSIKDLVVQIQHMEMRLNQKIEDLGYDIQRNIDEMKETVIDEISQLNDGSSILPLINTFQLIGIKNKLK